MKDLKNKKFLKLDKEAYKLLSNNGILVYLAFVDIHPNANPTDNHMSKKANMGLSRYKKAKAELIEHDFLYVQRLGAKGAIIVYHFGKNAVENIRKQLKKKLDYSQYEEVKKQPFQEEVEN